MNRFNPDRVAITENHTKHGPRIVICNQNPTYRDGLQLVLRNTAPLAGFTIVTSVEIDPAAYLLDPPELIILDPWQRTTARCDVPALFCRLATVTALIGFCQMTKAEARALSLAGFRGLMPETVETEEFSSIVTAVGFGGIFLHESLVDDGGATTSSGDHADAVLSAREIEVLRQVAFGSSMKEIAATLKISAKTVDTYKNRANQKLKLRTRNDIVKFALQSGWLN